MIEAVAESRVTPTRSPVAAALGLLSLTLLGALVCLGASLGRAGGHARGLLGGVTGAFVVSIRILRDDMVWLTRFAFRLVHRSRRRDPLDRRARRSPGMAYAAGINPTGACGGG